MRRSLASTLLMAGALMLVATMLVGCTEHHDEPWINPGQQELLGDRYQRDEETQQQLRDRMRSIQAQR
jgi:hypothetical protein